MSNATAMLLMPSAVASQPSSPLTRVSPSPHALSTSNSAFTNGSVTGFCRQSQLHHRASSSQRIASTVQPLAMAGERASGGGGFDIWLGRAAMLGFVAALGVEITTGKGVLQSVGLEAPLPSLALGLTGLVGVVTAFKVFRSTQEE